MFSCPGLWSCVVSCVVQFFFSVSSVVCQGLIGTNLNCVMWGVNYTHSLDEVYLI